MIGFAFMVPDVDHHEAYISFLFTHPEWRRAGIAKFMVYHLIQVTFVHILYLVQLKAMLRSFVDIVCAIYLNVAKDKVD